MPEDNRDLIQQLGNISDALGAMAERFEAQAAAAARPNANSGTVGSAQIIDAIQSVKRDTKKIKSRTEEIYEMMSDVKKKKKDTSMLGNLASPDNKTSLVSGIKSIILIAAGILAIGAAFMLLGAVDFKTVIALSLAMPLLAHAFAKVADTKGLSMKSIALSTVALVAMSFAMAAASWVLQMVMPISIPQALTVLAIAGVMAIASYGMKTLSKAVGEVSFAKLVMAATLMPLMAAGLALSSVFLTNMPTMTIEQGLTAGAIAIVMSIAAVGMGMLIKALKGATWQQLIFAGIAMPLMAAGLLASAHILNKFPVVDIDLMSVTKTALAMGIAGVLMGIPIVMFSKMNVSPKDMLTGILGIVGIMGAMALGSHLLSMGDYSNAPSIGWAAAVGLALIAMTPAVIALGLATSLLGPMILAGYAGVVGLGGALALVSLLVAKGDYTSGPSIGWSAGLALAMIAMVPAVILLGVPGMQIIVGLGVISMLMMAKGLVEIGSIVAGGNFSGGPSASWAFGIGTALIMFGSAVANVSPGLLGVLSGDTTAGRVDTMVKMASSLKDIAAAVKGGDYSGGPSPMWSMGIGLALAAFTSSLKNLDTSLFSDNSADNIELLVAMGRALRRISVAVTGGSYDVYPSKDWVEGVMGYMNIFVHAAKYDDELKDGMVSMMMMANSGGFLQKMMASISFAASPTAPIRKAASEIDLLGRAYANLARALMSMSRSLQAISAGDKMPNMSSITEALVAMSVVDSEKLKETLNVLEARKDTMISLLETGSGAQVAAASDGGGFLSNIANFLGGSNEPVAQAPQQQGANQAASTQQAAPKREARVKEGPMTVVNSAMEKSLSSIDTKMDDLVRVFGEVLGELRKPKVTPSFDKSKK